jgi:hypothetical protein
MADASRVAMKPSMLLSSFVASVLLVACGGDVEVKSPDDEHHEAVEEHAADDADRAADKADRAADKAQDAADDAHEAEKKAD